MLTKNELDSELMAKLKESIQRHSGIASYHTL